LDVDPGQRNEFQRSTVLNAFRDTDTAYQKRRQELDSFRKKEPSLPTSLVMRELPQPRPTRIFIKGDFTRPGDTVSPSTPANLPVLKSGSTFPSRLDLAKWLVSRDNPLTARVLVNRVWQQYFGKGIVETENDFGTQGAPPTHPELLDWLAVSFMNEGWSLKQLHRQIVTSTTYRQTSRISKKDGGPLLPNPTLDRALELDPLNRLLWRQNRLRLDAEIIRDTQLAISGVLDQTIGGAPVFPPQPAGLDAFTQNKREWKTSTGGARYRRAVYTHIQRTTFHPALSVFDAADGYFTCTRRTRSNTPLQALTLLNDPAFAEFAAVLGRSLQQPIGTDVDRIVRGFVLCIGRSPSTTEIETLHRLLDSERKASQDSQAAWISVARVLLNLDETITRE
jgi:hypothetical protein